MTCEISSGKFPKKIQKFAKFPETSGNFQNSSRECPGNFPEISGNFRKLSGTCPGKFPEFSGYVRKCSGNFLEMSRKFRGNGQSFVPEISRKLKFRGNPQIFVPDISRKFGGNLHTLNPFWGHLHSLERNNNFPKMTCEISSGKFPKKIPEIC